MTGPECIARVRVLVGDYDSVANVFTAQEVVDAINDACEYYASLTGATMVNNALIVINKTDSGLKQIPAAAMEMVKVLNYGGIPLERTSHRLEGGVRMAFNQEWGYRPSGTWPGASGTNETRWLMEDGIHIRVLPPQGVWNSRNFYLFYQEYPDVLTTDPGSLLDTRILADKHESIARLAAAFLLDQDPDEIDAQRSDSLWEDFHMAVVGTDARDPK